ncbi:hypothetical protein ACFE04_011891 [Oxalis oulophora]
MPSKRSNGGGRPLNLLERRVASCRNNNKNLSTVEDIAEHLRSTVPEYRRVKLAVLTMQVRKIQSVSTTNSKPPRLVFETDEEDDEDELEIERSSRKKSRRGGGGGGYEKDDNSLQRIEDEHIRKRQSNNHDSSSSSASSSESSEEEEGVSTSEDAVYSEKLEEPEFDVTRATLRKNYTPKKLNEKEKEKNIEIEIASEKKRVSSVDMMNSQGVKLNANKENISNGETRKGESVEEETGTMFKDLGGMENVIEELKMEVIAGNLAMRRIFDQRKTELSGEPVDAEHSEDWWKKPWLQEEVEKLTITMADFEVAAKMVQPSTRREGFSDIPNVKWDDVGGLEYLRQEFERYIIRRIKNPEDYEGIGVNLESGFLLYGPPGCGKTLIAKAVAHEAGATFIHIKGPELLNKYVGEGEAAVRNLFVRARRSSPCILFFDEVDALTTNRGKEGGWVVERILNTLLIELDGAEKREAVYIIGATNRPEVMDHALLRPGRFGKLLYVPLPNPDERGHILKALGMKKRIDETLDLNDIAKMEGCQNFSGADLAALINEAAMASLDDKLNSIETQPSAGPCTIKAIHFERALTKVSRSVSDKQIKYYEHLKNNFKSA